MIDLILLYWALPALLTLLILLSFTRHGIKLIEEFDGSDWYDILFASVIYPIGMFIILCEFDFLKKLKFLVKERKW